MEQAYAINNNFLLRVNIILSLVFYKFKLKCPIIFKQVSDRALTVYPSPDD